MLTIEQAAPARRPFDLPGYAVTDGHAADLSCGCWWSAAPGHQVRRAQPAAARVSGGVRPVELPNYTHADAYDA